MFRLEFETGNDAFVADPTGEVHRILLDVAGHVRSGRESGHLKDINGNVVGEYLYTPGEPEDEDSAGFNFGD